MLVTSLLVLAGSATLAWYRLSLRPPSVARASLWTAPVRREPFVLKVHATGTLRPEGVRWVTAESSGRVAEISLDPGAEVEVSTLLVRLENLDLALLVSQARRDVQNAEAQHLSLLSQSRLNELTLQSDLLSIRSKLRDAERRALAYAAAPGEIVSRHDDEATRDLVAQMRQQESLLEQKLALGESMTPRQLEVAVAQVRQMRQVLEVREQMIERLRIVAGSDGTLQELSVELGQWVLPGTRVGKVQLSQRLEAVLRVPADRAGRVRVGQAARVRTGFGTDSTRVIAGRVRRIAPAARNATVDVEIALDGELPNNARPDQSVDGEILTDRVLDALVATRPTGLERGDEALVFVVDPSGNAASRRTVRFGRRSVDTVEVLSGLQPGDELILSDLSDYRQHVELLLE